MLTVIETPTYLRSIAGIWTDGEAAEFVDFIAAYPHAGDVMVGTGGLRKVRWSRSGMGKRGGVRAIYLYRNDKGELVLLMAYSKAKFDTLPSDFLIRIKAQYDV
ncbi:transcriptional regulator [Limnohabitans sp. T6-5]|uniref:transcriptional regulator n=1 Tax=Limnohabitans sp. T6-5 TaxID=1100724 RepID=UPI000D35B44D|nr:transcriptional regulator [Limnohabitans sp. T6-5]PUE10818.1 transcriptional regulator [Limnohabitans sp. T6-5]